VPPPGRKTPFYKSPQNTEQTPITTSLFQLPTSADNVALPAYTDARSTAARLLLSAGQQSIDISCSPDPQQQTRIAAACGEQMGQRYRQTDGRPTVA